MFEFLDHPSETLVRVKAWTVEEVFQDAAQALFEIMTDTGKIRAKELFQVDLESSERHLLLIDWLNRLILVHEVENVFLSKFDVKVSVNHLTANVSGEKIRPNHERRSHAKSATYGQLQWIENKDGHEVRFVIDV